MKSILLMCGIGLLVGCASQPTATPEQWYITMATNEAMTNLCYEAELMDSDTSATGMYLLSVYRNQTAHDPNKLSFRVNEAKGALTPVKKEHCRQYTQLIKTEKLKLESRQKAATSQRSTSSDIPKQTQCSTYFGQTHCTTY